MGDTPICVLLDGKESVNELRTTYDVRIIRQTEIGHPGLRRLGGSTIAKLAALWVAPFERFLFLDADTIVWGDVRRLADLERFDCVISAPYGHGSKKGIMDADAATRHFPHFDARRHETHYANSGVFFARRGLLELDDYLEVVAFSQRHRGVFSADQGILNFMLFSRADEGTLRLDQQELQVKVGEDRITRVDLAQRFRFVEGQPTVVGPPTVIHWVGTLKPRVREGVEDFFQPMTFFRLQFRSAQRGGTTSHAVDGFRLRLEDALCDDWRGKNLRGRLRRRRRRAAQRRRYLFGRLKIAVRTRTPAWVVATVRGRGSKP